MPVHCIAGSAKLQLGIIMDNQKNSASTPPDVIVTLSLQNPELAYELPSWRSAFPGSAVIFQPVIN
jgi:hypothetical protein